LDRFLAFLVHFHLNDFERLYRFFSDVFLKLFLEI